MSSKFSSQNRAAVVKPDFELFPWKHGAVTIFLDAAEFTALCPITKAPTFGRITIEYTPLASLMDPKSVEEYLAGWRDKAEIGEAIVVAIADAIHRQVKPRSVTVTGHFRARDGISPTIVAMRGEA